MEAVGAPSFPCTGINFDKFGQKPTGFVQFSRGFRENQTIRVGNSRELTQSIFGVRARLVGFELSCSYKNAQVSAVESEKSFYIEKEIDKNHVSVDEAMVLKKKSHEVAPYLNGRCIYLVGMMGSGKSTVGKILSEVLGYSFFDSDKLVEKAVHGTPVAEIFKKHSETFFRDNESKVLHNLSSMRRLVVATGGGAVIRPINWKYMKKGLTVFLDVPLEALARRIAAVGTASRPLLHDESGDAYTKALIRLSTLSEERGDVYGNADVKVSLEYIAGELGLGDVSDLTPSAIAIEALIQVEKLL
ncbi:hypothetical protein GIB67_022611 [Kingdonia uniflora]|uniref:shikimate kinase n=1 Tax=Kingdonia uniflora TaxID=39325 RepID=A0A7J7P856_9MAGN|nr:hypothetical protein GIB67_022611 [Kingdonia uniflora]